MSAKKKTVFLVLAFALVLIVATAAYRALGAGGGGLAVLGEEQKDGPSSAASESSAVSGPSESSEQSADSESAASSSEAESGGEPIPAPDFTVYNAEGEAVTLSSLLDRPAIINFWASTCPPCKQEMPDFQSAYETYGEEIAFIMVDGVGSMLNETQEAGAAYVAEQGFTFPVYFDNDRDAVSTYGITGFPTTFFVGGDGNLVAAAQGMISAETLEQGISMILPET